MTILVDPPAWPFRGRLFSHLASDTSIAHLHAFARAVGLHPRSYDGDHYDVPQERYDEVVAAGARPATSREVLVAIQAAGLRFRKRRGERPVDSLPNAVPGLGVEHRMELLTSPFEAPAASTVAAAAVVTDPRGAVLLVPSTGPGAWEAPWAWVRAGRTARGAAVGLLASHGLAVEESALEAVGHVRLTCDEAPRHPRLHRVSHVAVYAVTRPATQALRRAAGPPRPPASAVWVDDAEVRARCAGASWWPLLERYLDDSRASSTARLSRAAPSQPTAAGEA